VRAPPKTRSIDYLALAAAAMGQLRSSIPPVIITTFVIHPGKLNEESVLLADKAGQHRDHSRTPPLSPFIPGRGHKQITRQILRHRYSRGMSLSAVAQQFATGAMCARGAGHRKRTKSTVIAVQIIHAGSATSAHRLRQQPAAIHTQLAIVA